MTRQKPNASMKISSLFYMGDWRHFIYTEIPTNSVGKVVGYVGMGLAKRLLDLAKSNYAYQSSTGAS
jgi:hypothetical protein